MDFRHFRWKFPADAERYIRANNTYIVNTLKQLRFQHDPTAAPGDVEVALFQLKKLMDYRASRLPVLLENFDPSALHKKKGELKSFLEELIRLSQEPHPILDCPTQCELDTDWDMLGKIFQRLLNNAEKYGIVGPPVRVTVTAESSSVVLCVTNYATEVPESEKEKLCGYHFRGSNAQHLHGSGEGLWFCKQAAQTLNGTFDIIPETIGALQGFDLAGLAIYGQLEEKEKKWAQDKYENLQWAKAQAVFANLEMIIGSEDYIRLNQEYRKAYDSHAVYTANRAAERLSLLATAKYIAKLTLNKEGEAHG